MFSFLSKRVNFVMMNVCCFQRNLSAALPPLVPIQLPSKLETHFWYVLPDDVKSESLLHRYLEILSPIEKEHVYRMRGDQLKKSALLARVLVRTTVARYQTNYQVDPRSLKFRKNSYGKPEVDWENVDKWCPQRLQFNISHTSSLVACGVTVNVPIGIDVEEKQRRLKNNILAFARRYFSADEVKLLTAISDPEIQHQEFIKLWTLKEAYVKALGRGFSAAPFKTFTIRSRAASKGGSHVSETLDSEASEIVVESSDNPENLTSNWQFALFDLAASHYAAICMEKEKSIGGEASMPMGLTVWKTIPYVEDECVSGTGIVVPISGLSNCDHVLRVF
ncbi:4'-phosphopantetheinyl transferase [Melia azedarach]|uniref:4'-phosphopantetheinyl transferase n=2 Tax=Melia azedarach TaxID=155640 RepID=A0ACC1X3Q6_MELAZ|nr:4'-phosphopantetheinyl transferase [Melia azedarach]KAJ4705278.1 4'-phosphopantetheinyl transferase [Melia azedarach]